MLKEANPLDLTDRHERTLARLERRARADTLFGGALASVYADRLTGLFGDLEYNEVVSSVYSASTGRPDRRWTAFACPECGQTHLGEESALKCCEWDD